MPKTVNPFMDFVFGLDDTQYDLLCDCVNQRNDKKLYGFSSYEEACKFWLNGAEFPIKMVQKFWNNGTSFTDERCAFFIL